MRAGSKRISFGWKELAGTSEKNIKDIVISNMPNRNGARTLQEKAYSAGMVKLSFWFAEFRKVLGLLSPAKRCRKSER